MMTPQIWKIRKLVIILGLAIVINWGDVANADLKNSIYIEAKEKYRSKNYEEAYVLLLEYLSEDKKFILHNKETEKKIKAAVKYSKKFYDAKQKGISLSVSGSGAGRLNPPLP